MEMKAVSYTTYGPPEVLQIVDVEKPQPKANEVLIKVHATTMNRTDCGWRSAHYFISRFFTGLLRPKKAVMGSEFAGEVIEVGTEVSEFVVGDKIFGFDDTRGDAHAEYMVERSNGPIANMPKGFTYEQMAPAGEGATYALNCIEAAGVKKVRKYWFTAPLVPSGRRQSRYLNI
jgi:NADPH:quinone reductase-like Zn-dependent oxidoreductase